MWIIFANAQLIKAPFHDVTFKKLQFELEGAIMKFQSKDISRISDLKENPWKQQICLPVYNQNFLGFSWLKASDINNKKYWMFLRIFSV